MIKVSRQELRRAHDAIKQRLEEYFAIEAVKKDLAEIVIKQQNEIRFLRRALAAYKANATRRKANR